jgi:hypothetical protein
MRTVLGLVGGSVQKKHQKTDFAKRSKKLSFSLRIWTLRKRNGGFKGSKRRKGLSFSALEMETGEYEWQLAPPPPWNGIASIH